MDLENRKETEAIEEAKAEKKPRAKKLRNKNIFKHGGYAIMITAIVIAVCVAVNAVFAVLGSRVNLDIDISGGDNSLSIDNVDFLKEIDKEVTITVCSTREDYVNGYLDYYAQQLYGATDSTGEYYAQTLELLDLYSVYSDKITVKFVDPQEPEFADIVSSYTNSNLQFGDMIVESTHIIDGEEIVRSSFVSYSDIYYLYDSSGYASMGYDYYYVSGNNFETAMTGAIYKVTSEETAQAGFITTHCDVAYAENLASTLNVNNFDIHTIEDSVITEIDDELDMLVIMAPKEDFLAEELEAIDKWLVGDENRGKGILYFASVYSPELPNLNEYLEEWGIIVDEGILFETNEGNHLPGDPTVMAMLSAESEDTAVLDLIGSNSQYIVGDSVPMSLGFDNNGTRYADALIVTDESVVIAPKDVDTAWEPDSTYVKAEQVTAILARDMAYVDNVQKSSYIVAFSSTDFIASDYVTVSGVHNLDLALSAANTVSGMEADPMQFTMKYFETEEFSASVSESGVKAMTAIFQIALPVLTIMLGIFIFVRRSRR